MWTPTAEDADMELGSFPPPPFDEEYFEWIDLLESVRAARGRYVVGELAAGYGRWSLRAARALERMNPLPLTIVAVEAEPTHFAWMKEHFSDNGIDPPLHDLIPAAVSCTEGFISFHVGKPSAWYGQSIVGNATT